METLVHTGQHYDDCMSGVFFRDLEIPEAKYNLGVGSGTHGYQTGEMLKGIENLLVAEKHDLVLVYGDTNSTLAGALAAAKLHIPVAHVEAGLRSFNRQMPEEINRVMTDHVSTFLFCPTDTAVQNLSREGINDGVYLTGDVMYDALVQNICLAEKRSDVLLRYGLKDKQYFLATVHRAENTDNVERLRGILCALMELVYSGRTIVFPLHPRTRKLVDGLDIQQLDRLILLPPVSYLDMLCLEKHAKVILTDSGGVQKEAFWLAVPCVTLRNETEWVETVKSGWNLLVGVRAPDIIKGAYQCETAVPLSAAPILGGDASGQIVAALTNSTFRSTVMLCATPSQAYR
jgi:UDP-N-acetylglucosamine 2-epimerase